MNQFICETCNKNFQSRYSLQEHKSLHLNIKPYVCKFCSQPSRLKGNMRKHIIAHHKDHYKNKINYVKKGNLFYKDKDFLEFLDSSMVFKPAIETKTNDEQNVMSVVALIAAAASSSSCPVYLENNANEGLNDDLEEAEEADEIEGNKFLN
uniref:C2H2-type domain-containing protein n=1 Tax=Meloidogyne incognita TaxID=6306 RepID=A0A914MGR9_MELIC